MATNIQQPSDSPADPVVTLTHADLTSLLKSSLFAGFLAGRASASRAGV